MAARERVSLGIDAGGTYTDAVLFHETDGVIAKAKALTTRHDLSIGIGEAVDNVLAAAVLPPDRIGLVSVSTTLATNTLVERKMARAALVLIGFDRRILKDPNLASALGNSPVVFCPGGHDGFGVAAPLDLAPLEECASELRGTVAGVAICGQFAVRNPEHELAAQQLVIDHTGLPTTMSHVLSSRLGGPRRAVTALLNAGLVASIDQLLAACRTYLESQAIDAPLMVVRGDGSLVSAGFARANPVETILSGPAAGLVGARYLAGLSDAVVSDIGGTTTDITIIENGHPKLDPEGANVGGLRTMVQAVASSTFGIGGDSEIGFARKGNGKALTIGPRRMIPLSLAATQHGAAVLGELERQSRLERIGEAAGRFALRGVRTAAAVSGLPERDKALYDRIGDRPVPLDTLLLRTAEKPALQRLVDRGLVHLCGFTPSDAAHVLGLQANWSARAAELGAGLFARQRDGFGDNVAESAQALASQVLATVTRASAEAILATALSADGADGAAMIASPALQRALEPQSGHVRLSARLTLPVLGLGASAGLHYKGLPEILGTDCMISEHGDVANAVGAVVGQVTVSVSAFVQQPADGVFRVSAGRILRDFSTLDEALDWAEREIRSIAGNKALEAGAAEPEIAALRRIKSVAVEDRTTFIEAEIIASASGRPRQVVDVVESPV